MKLKEFVTHTQSFIESLNTDNVDQGQYTYRPGEPCNLGAHLAAHFGITPAQGGRPKDWEEHYYNLDMINGWVASAKFVGCNPGQFAMLLHAAGSTRTPFFTPLSKWPFSLGGVWRTLPRIRKLPPWPVSDKEYDDWLAGEHGRLRADS